MKTSIILLAAVLCLSLSCKEAQKEVGKEKDKIEVEKGEVLDDCIKVDKRIYPQTTWIWAESWVSAFNHIYTDTISSSPELYFDKESLTQLKSNDATGVRLYYILRNESDKIPSLAMVNIVNCKDKICDEKCVLVSWVNPETGTWVKPDLPLLPNPAFISYSDFNEYKKNWEIADVKKDGYIQVTAYNYSWNTINTLSSVEKGMNGIRVKYGARTIELSEEKEYGVVEKDTVEGKLPITGNIVACNVLLGWNSETKSFKEALIALAEDEGLDFAKPCPQYCGNNQ